MTERGVTPEDAFAQLGNEIRIDIIRVLGESGPLSFTELHERVGVRDSGQFNYHFNQLTNSFVTKTGEGEYRLSYAGVRVIGAIYSGEFGQGGSRSGFPLESECVLCSTRLQAAYEDEIVSVQCPECGGVESSFGFPPGGIEGRDPEELTTVFDRWLKDVFTLICDGICNNCTGRLTPSFTAESKFLHPDDPVCLKYECNRCPDKARLSISSYLFLHPEVVGYYYEHGVDLHSVDMWNARSFLDLSIEVISENPWEIEAVLNIEGDQRKLIINDELLRAA